MTELSKFEMEKRMVDLNRIRTRLLNTLYDIRLSAAIGEWSVDRALDVMERVIEKELYEGTKE